MLVAFAMGRERADVMGQVQSTDGNLRHVSSTKESSFAEQGLGPGTRKEAGLVVLAGGHAEVASAR